MSTLTKRGAFIVFEGLDRSGKTTQCSMLFNHLQSQNIPATLLRFPDRTTVPIGQMLDSYLQNKTEMQDEVAHLLFSSNRWENRNKILELLSSGKTLLVDRYAYSGVAFSVAKGLDLKWCLAADRGLPAPDLVFLLDLTVDDAAKRGGYGSERFETVQFQRNVFSVYHNHLRGPNWKLIDARLSVEQIHQQLCEYTKEILSQIENKPIAKLWSGDDQ